MNNPGKEHWMEVKWILRYLTCTINQTLCFGVSHISLLGYADADMEGDRDNRRITQGMCLLYVEQLSIGFQNCRVLLYSQRRKQSM